MQATLQVFFQSIVDHKIVADADSKLTAFLYIIKATKQAKNNRKIPEFKIRKVFLLKNMSNCPVRQKMRAEAAIKFTFNNAFDTFFSCVMPKWQW